MLFLYFPFLVFIYCAKNKYQLVWNVDRFINLSQFKLYHLPVLCTKLWQSLFSSMFFFVCVCVCVCVCVGGTLTRLKGQFTIGLFRENQRIFVPARWMT